MRSHILLVLSSFVAANSCVFADSAKPAPDPIGALLIKACEEGNDNQVSVFLAEGASITAVDAEGFTPLMKAAMGAHPAIVKKLLALKAPVDATDQYGETPLNLAAWNGDADTVQQLCEAGANPNTVSTNGATPLLGAAWRGELKIMGLLLDDHAKINASTLKGTPLSIAAGNDKPDAVKLLLDRGADPNVPPRPGTMDDSALTPLAYAADFGNQPELDMLLAHGAKPDQQQLGFSPLMAAARHGFVPILQELKAKGAELDRQDNNGNSALIHAARWGEFEVVKQLVDWKADLNLKDHDGETALIAGLPYGRTDVAIYLCQNGAEVNAKDNRGESAWSYAQNRGYLDVIDALKARGAVASDLHVIPFTTMHPLSPARAWGLAIAGPYLQADGESPLELLGHGDATDGAIRMLKESWGVTDHDSLLAELHDLATVGHRSKFTSEGAQFAGMDDKALADFIAKHAEHENTVHALRASYQKWKDRSGLAFDLVRYVNLVDNGFCAHYLTEAESWDLIMPMAKKAQESFTSWQELGANFLDGREIWKGDRDPRYDAIIALLANPKDANSPWNKPWNTDLGTTVDTDTSFTQ